MPAPARPPLTVCVLTYGDHYRLAHRCLESLRRHTHRSLYRLVVGANAPGPATRQYLRDLERAGAIDALIVSRRNLNKCPMMRLMFREVASEFIGWFDDDSYLTEPHALDRMLATARASPRSIAIWGQAFVCHGTKGFINIPDVPNWIRAAPWYQGLTPPYWEPGGKGEFNFDQRGLGDGRWIFVTGGFWIIRTKVIRRLDWPDPRLIKMGDDVLLCEALRQHGWYCQSDPCQGVAISAEPRRGKDGRLPARPPRGPARI